MSHTGTNIHLNTDCGELPFPPAPPTKNVMSKKRTISRGKKTTKIPAPRIPSNDHGSICSFVTHWEGLLSWMSLPQLHCYVASCWSTFSFSYSTHTHTHTRTHTRTHTHNHCKLLKYFFFLLQHMHAHTLQVVGVLFLSPTAHTHTHTHTHSTCTHCPDPQQWLSAVAVKETEVWEVRFHAVALALRSHPSHKPVWLLFE